MPSGQQLPDPSLVGFNNAGGTSGLTNNTIGTSNTSLGRTASLDGTTQPLGQAGQLNNSTQSLGQSGQHLPDPLAQNNLSKATNSLDALGITSGGNTNSLDLATLGATNPLSQPSLNAGANSLGSGASSFGTSSMGMAGANSISQIILDQGMVTKQQFEQCNQESLISNRAPEQIMVEKGFIKKSDISKAKGIMYGIPFVDLTTITIPKEANEKLGEELARKAKILIFDNTPGAVKAAMANPLDIQSIRLVEQTLGVRLQVFITDEDILMLKIASKVSTAQSEVTQLVEQAVSDSDIVDLTNEDTSLEGVNIVTAPIAKIINGLLQNAAQIKASDVHIEPLEERIRVRFRINGILEEVRTFPLTLLSSLVSRIKILAGLAIDEKRKPQDGRFQIKYNQDYIDLRVSTLPTVHGEKVVIRLLRKDLGILSLEDTGMRGSTLKIFMDGIKATSGIILITGPTGSGKTVTVATSMHILNKPEVNVVSIEDPVEIRVPGVNQVQVNNDAGLTFANALRAFLRQDPNIISVGEIRDGETASLAAQASLTGHLVISTLHTNSAAGVLPRLMDMGIEPYILASAVHLCTAQRLARRVCKSCIYAYPIRDFEEAEFRTQMTNPGGQNIDIKALAESQVKYLDGIQIMDPEGNQVLERKEGQLYLFKGRGCDQCHDTGYTGRIGIFEAYKVTEKIGSIIMHNATTDQIEKAAVEDGMIKMIQDGYFKALEGLTTIEEVQRVIKS